MKELQTSEIADRLERLPSATLYDVLDSQSLGDTCCLSHEIRPLKPGHSLAGPASTFRWAADPRSVEEWNPPGLRRIGDYFERIASGSVIVVDGGGDNTCGHWGR